MSKQLYPLPGAKDFSTLTAQKPEQKNVGTAKAHKALAISGRGCRRPAGRKPNQVPDMLRHAARRQE